MAKKSDKPAITPPGKVIETGVHGWQLPGRPSGDERRAEKIAQARAGRAGGDAEAQKAAS